MSEQTLGQKRVKAEFNPAKNGTVDQIKNLSAKMIDIAHSGHDNGGVYEEDLYNKQDQLRLLFLDPLETKTNAHSFEKKRLETISLKHLQKGVDFALNGDDDAEEEFETACMYAVKWCFTE